MKHNSKAIPQKAKVAFRKVTKNGSTYSISLTEVLKGWEMVKVTYLYVDKDMVGVSLEKVSLENENNAQVARIQKTGKQDA